MANNFYEPEDVTNSGEMEFLKLKLWEMVLSNMVLWFRFP